MIWIVNDNYDGDGLKVSIVYDPMFDGPIEMYEKNPDWEVIYD